MTEQTLHIQAYSILEYTQKIKEAIEERFEFKLDTNEGTPQQIGFYYEVMMYKKESKLVSVDTVQGEDSVEPVTIKQVSVATVSQAIEGVLPLGTTAFYKTPDYIATTEPLKATAHKPRGRPTSK